jgi:hypothetical protein
VPPSFVGERPVGGEVRDHLGDQAGEGDADHPDDEREERIRCVVVLHVRRQHEDDREAGEGRVDALLEVLRDRLDVAGRQPAPVAVLEAPAGVVTAAPSSCTSSIRPDSAVRHGPERSRRRGIECRV